MGSEKPTATDPVLKEQLRYGIASARAGDLRVAYTYFNWVLEREPTNQQALIWKSAVSPDASEAVQCLEQVLRLNPSNQRARAGLEWARQRAQEQTPAEKPALGFIEETLSQPSMPPQQPVRSSAIEDFRSVGLNEEQARQHRLETLAEATTRELNKAGPLSSAESNPDNRLGPARPETKDRATSYNKQPLSEDTRPMAKVGSATPAQPDIEPAASDRNRPSSSSQLEESSIFRAASPKVAFTLSNGARNAGRVVPPARTIALRWPCLAFSLAFGLALLTFPLNAIAPVVGVLALIAALAGVLLFNRAQF